MLELIWCHCTGKASGLEFCSTTGRNGVSEVYDTRPACVGLGQRSQRALDLSCQTHRWSWRWSQDNRTWQTYRCLPSTWPCKWSEGWYQPYQHLSDCNFPGLVVHNPIRCGEVVLNLIHSTNHLESLCLEMGLPLTCPP